MLANGREVKIAEFKAMLMERDLIALPDRKMLTYATGRACSSWRPRNRPNHG